MSQEQQELFEESFDSTGKASGGRDLRSVFEIPLPERVRPTSLEEFVGQSHLLGEGKPLRRLLEAGQVPNSILYGPPGTGKTTLVMIMANVTKRKLLEINAVTAKV